VYTKFIGGGNMLKAKVFVAEFIGTFALVFVGAAAAIYDKALGILGIALAYGLTLAVFVYLYGRISGAHFNPAVTIGLAANGNIKWSDAAFYWVAQFLGAVFAALLLHMFVTVLSNDAFSLATPVGLLTAKHPYYAMALEALLTFFLVTVFLHTMVDSKQVRPLAGWALGATLVIAVLAGYPFTGASLNPARSFGPALFTKVIIAGKADYLNVLLYLVYFIGPFIGSVLAALLYRFFKSEPATEAETEDAEEVVAENPAARETTRK
jgi:MIP family channel proteins